MAQARNLGGAAQTALSRHMSQVFNYMMGGVAISGLVAFLTVSNPALAQMALQANTILMIVWLVSGIALQMTVFKLQPVTALIGFAAFSALTGFFLAPLALYYTGGSIASAFFTAAVMFGGASAYGYFTGKSLSGWGNFLMMGMWGLFGAAIVNMVLGFFGHGIGGFNLVFSIISIPLFAGMTAWQTNTIKSTFFQFAGNELMRSRIAILSAIQLYLYFLNIFMSLLNLMGQRR